MHLSFPSSKKQSSSSLLRKNKPTPIQQPSRSKHRLASSLHFSSQKSLIHHFTTQSLSSTPKSERKKTSTSTPKPERKKKSATPKPEKKTSTSTRKKTSSTLKEFNPYFLQQIPVDSTKYASVFLASMAKGATPAMVGTEKQPFVQSHWLNHNIVAQLDSSAKDQLDDDNLDDNAFLVQSAAKGLKKKKKKDNSLSPPITYSFLDPNLRILNASWQALFDTSTLSLYQSFLSSRIPSSQYLDLEARSLSDSPKPLAYSSPEEYYALLSQLGITKRHSIVLYDYNGLHGAAFAHWLLCTIGFAPQKLRILSGGWQNWIQSENNHIQSTNIIKPVPSTFLPHDRSRATIKQHLIEDEEMFDLGYAYYTSISNGFVDENLPLLLDTRSPQRYIGKLTEPSALTLRSLYGGHVPGSLNVPYASLVKLCPETDRGIILKSAEELRKTFLESFVELPSQLEHPIIVMSGTGTTAAVARLALMSLGYTNIRLYNSSWSVYGNMSLYSSTPRPIEVGPSHNSLLNPKFKQEATKYYSNLLRLADDSQAQLVFDPDSLATTATSTTSRIERLQETLANNALNNKEEVKLSPILEVLLNAARKDKDE